MNQEELNEVLRLHKLWVDGDFEGARADLLKANLRRFDLRGAYLRGSYLSRANLTGADLRGSNLTGANLFLANLSDANLFLANLRGADLRGSNLTGANLTGANLTDADLTGADLTGANLFDTVGNGREIKNIDTTGYEIAYTSEVIQIGCKNYTIEEWRNFTDEEISAMDEDALAWWKENKEMIFSTIEEDPATPTQGRKMKQEELSEVLRLHELWVDGEKEGVRADLSRADLTDANLTGVDLFRADLSGANLFGAYLSITDLTCANLSEANLSRANLTGAYLSGAYLTGAYLTGAYLTGAYLCDCVGNGREIKNIDTTVYEIAYTSEVIQIGCQNHTIDEWRNFSDEEISEMDEGALAWWKKNKAMIFATIEEDPATPTQDTEY